MDYNKLLDKIRRRYRDFEKFDHLNGVAITAAKLARLFYPEAEKKAEIAGLLHDIARYYSEQELLSIARENGLALSNEENKMPILLHGKISAIIAKKLFFIKDKEILEAISNHVTGCEIMPLLSKIIFVADVIEPTRHFEGVQELRDIAFKDLDGAFVRVLANKIIWLVKNNLFISEKTLKLWNKTITLRRQ